METIVKVLLIVAVIVIAVVILLPSLFVLGVFSTASIGGPSGVTCLARAGFLCQDQFLSTSGKLNFTLGQNLGKTVYNVELACFSSATPQEVQLGEWQPISTMGIAENSSYSGQQLSMQSGTTMMVSGLNCYNQNGTQVSGPVGTPYVGNIWILYTNNASTPDSSNFAYSESLAEIYTKIT